MAAWRISKYDEWAFYLDQFEAKDYRASAQQLRRLERARALIRVSSSGDVPGR